MRRAAELEAALPTSASSEEVVELQQDAASRLPRAMMHSSARPCDGGHRYVTRSSLDDADLYPLALAVSLPPTSLAQAGDLLYGSITFINGTHPAYAVYHNVSGSTTWDVSVLRALGLAAAVAV